MKKNPGRKPALSQVGWTFGRGYLPFPKNRSLLWKIASDIIDGKGQDIVVLGHHNADIDAVATALIIKWTFPWVRIGAFRSISQPGRKLLDHFDVEMEIDPDITDTSLILFIDSSSPNQVIEGDPDDWPEYHVIDHHREQSHWGEGAYIDDSMGACSEIALQMSMITGSPLMDRMTIAGIAGIVADTGKYRFARPVDLEVTSFLLGGSEIVMENVLDIIEGGDYFDVSRKIAQLKAAKRVRYRKVGDQIIATSKIRSFEAAACRTLLVAGADVAFVAAERKNELRVSSRAKPHLIRAGIHLGDFMEQIGNRTGNQGGGHDGAAGLNGKGKAERLLSLCQSEMASLLEKKLEKSRKK